MNNHLGAIMKYVVFFAYFIMAPYAAYGIETE